VWAEAERAEVSKRKPILDRIYSRQTVARAERSAIEQMILAVLQKPQTTRLKEIQIQTGTPTIAQHPSVKPILRLTEAQGKQIDSIQSRWMKEEMGIGKGLSREQYLASTEGPRKKYHALIMGVLTPQQRTKLLAMGGKVVDKSWWLSKRISVTSTR
jgi:hypothetical protein